MPLTTSPIESVGNWFFICFALLNPLRNSLRRVFGVQRPRDNLSSKERSLLQAMWIIPRYSNNRSCFTLFHNQPSLMVWWQVRGSNSFIILSNTFVHTAQSSMLPKRVPCFYFLHSWHSCLDIAPKLQGTSISYNGKDRFSVLSIPSNDISSISEPSQQIHADAVPPLLVVSWYQATRKSP